MINDDYFTEDISCMYEVDTSELSEGMIIKNHDEMCVLVDEDYCEGNERKAQLKRWRRYFRFTKKGHKYIIHEIYDIPLPNDDKRAIGNNKIYQQHMELVLLNYLARKCTTEITDVELTKKKIYTITGMCNDSYINTVPNNTFDMKDFYRRTHFKFDRLIDSMLSNLKHRYIINIGKGHKICNNKTQRSATHDEETKILEAKNIVLQNMGLNKCTEVYQKFRNFEFYKRLDKLLKQKYNWDKCYHVYILSFFKHSVEESIIQYRQELDVIKQERIALNNKIINSVDNQASKIYEKNKKEYEEYERIIKEAEEKLMYKDCDAISIPNKPFKLHYDYVGNQIELSKRFLAL